MTHQINKNWLTLATIDTIISDNLKLQLSEESAELVKKCRAYLDAKMQKNDSPIYGINTGFGSLCNTKIAKEDLEKLQRNLVTSHACGLGKEVPNEVVKLMLLFKIQGLSYGHSGVQLKTIQRLIDFYNNAVFPVVYQQGSLGASGDLAPLAHLSLPLLGKGEVYLKGKRMDAETALEKLKLSPYIELISSKGDLVSKDVLSANSNGFGFSL